MSFTEWEAAVTARIGHYIAKFILWLVVEYLHALNVVYVFVYRYSTFVVKYAWCFLLLGSTVCICLGLTAVLTRDLPDFNDPTKVTFLFCDLVDAD